MLSSSSRNERQKERNSVWLASGLGDHVTRGSKNPLWMGFAYRLSSVRVAANLTADAVNKLAQLSNNVTNGLEDGLHLPKVDTVERIACGLGISPSWLAYGPEGERQFQQKVPRPALPYEDPIPCPGSHPFRSRYLGCGGRLKGRRECLGLTLREVARLAVERTTVSWVQKEGTKGFRISHQAILLTESGATTPRIDTIEALAKALDLAPGWLAFGDDEPV